MANIKELLGDAYKDGMTLEEVDAALKDKKLVDLSTGEYVAKGKYDTLETKYQNLKSEHEQVKEQTKDYETLKAKNEAYEAEKQDADFKSKVVKYGIKESAYKYVKGDIVAKELELGEDEKVNQANVKKYLETHPEFANDTKPQGKTFSKHVGTSVVADPNDKSGAKSFNDKLREAFASGE